MVAQLVGHGFGFESVMDMPWTDAREFSACVAEVRGRRWLDMATAMRAAGADQKSWEKITRDLA